jgi:hypothetical protein
MLLSADHSREAIGLLERRNNDNLKQGICQPRLTPKAAKTSLIDRIAQNPAVKSRNTFVYKALVVMPALHTAGTKSMGLRLGMMKSIDC